MLAEWLAFIKPAETLLTGAKSIYDTVRGKQPTADFAPGPYGPPIFYVKNIRAETIIVEHVEAVPPLLVFAVGDEVRDMVEAIVRREGHGRERALFVLKPNEEMALLVASSFAQEKPEHEIKVTIYWRSSSRSWFSKSRLSKKITVGDINDLRRDSEKRGQRG
jgi:hypothetical protein